MSGSDEVPEAFREFPPGVMIHVAPAKREKHFCVPPGKPARSHVDFAPSGIEASVPFGSAWRCRCGLLWIVGYEGVWRRANWRELFIYRKRGR